MNLMLEFENLEKAFTVNSDKIEEYAEFIGFLTLHLEIKGKQKYYKSQKEKTLEEIQEKVEQKE